MCDLECFLMALLLQSRTGDLKKNRSTVEDLGASIGIILNIICVIILS